MSQIGVRVEIKRIYSELTLVEYNYISIRTLGRKKFYLKKKMRKKMVPALTIQLGIKSMH